MDGCAAQGGAQVGQTALVGGDSDLGAQGDGHFGQSPHIARPGQRNGVKGGRPALMHEQVKGALPNRARSTEDRDAPHRLAQPAQGDDQDLHREHRPEQRIETVQQPAMAGDQRRGILDPGPPLDPAFGNVPELTGHRHDRRKP